MTNQQPSTPTQPRERPLDDPATAITPKFAAVLVRRVRVVVLRRDDRLDPALRQSCRQIRRVNETGPEFRAHAWSCASRAGYTSTPCISTLP